MMDIRKKTPVLDKATVESTLNHIDEYWQNIRFSNKTDKGTLIGLPNDYIIPSASAGESFAFEEQYYWDTYFTLIGLNGPKYKELAQGMVDNLVHEYNRFGMIPNASRLYFLSRSQPPLLTSMINLIKTRFGCTDDWYNKTMQIAEDEYHKVWMSTQHPNWRRVGELNRYYDINALHDLAEAESGWDMTPRFSRKCLDYYPIDLNSLLFKYEKDLAQWYANKNEPNIAKTWEKRATDRAATLDELMWGKKRKFYFDYNFIDKKRGLTWSLAGFYPLWAGMIDENRAKNLVKQLPKFEKTGGLTTTAFPIIDLSLFGSVKTQWAYPNGWAPLHWLVIEGLENYGFYEDAERIAKKWLKTCTDWYIAHGEMTEKYNVANPTKEPLEGVYPNQSGFGWTNGVYVDLANRYVR